MKRFSSIYLLFAFTAAPTDAFPIAGRSAFLHRSGSKSVVAGSENRAKHVVCGLSYEEDLEMTRAIVLNHIAKSQKGDAVGDHASPAPASPPNKAKYTVPDTPENDLMIRAALGDTTIEKTPLWLFRQAGRHLPEYQKYKETMNMNFLELLKQPATVAECTMQPLRRYDVDAAILFSDILVVPQALGISVTMPGGVGIQVPAPLTSPDDLSRLTLSVDDASTPQAAAAFVEKELSHVLGAVKEIRKQMAAEKKSIPLIGFSAAPWTLMFYMVGGSSKKNRQAGVEWLQQHPEASTSLLKLLSTIVTEYLSAQVESGAHMLQIFEAMGMMIDDDNFVEFALPCLESIGKTLKERYPTVPLMMFCRGACQMNDKVAALGLYDVITIDGDVDRSTARDTVSASPKPVTLQGNYDPAELIESNGKTVDSVRASARVMLEELGPTRYIANLGEGLGGKESPELVKAFVDAIHEESANLMAASS